MKNRVVPGMRGAELAGPPASFMHAVGARNDFKVSSSESELPGFGCANRSHTQHMGAGPSKHRFRGACKPNFALNHLCLHSATDVLLARNWQRRIVVVFHRVAHAAHQTSQLTRTCVAMFASMHRDIQSAIQSAIQKPCGARFQPVMESILLLVYVQGSWVLPQVHAGLLTCTAPRCKGMAYCS
jgi:hypothetical protein